MPGFRQHGIALVVVLWLVALLALMAVSQTAAVRTETLIVGNMLESAKARAAAFAGVQLAIADLAKPITAREMIADGSIYTLQFDATQLIVSIRDESGKVDINAAPAPLLDALLQAAGIETARRESLVNAILDWRDRDDLRRVNGAEAAEYHTAGLTYGPRNGPFQSLEELALVIGFDAPLYHAIADSLTIYSGSAGINPAHASPAVQQLVSGNAEGEEEYADDQGAGADLPLRPRGASTMAGGSTFSIDVEAHLDSGVRERLSAVVRMIPPRANAPMRYEFLRWREGVRGRMQTEGEV